MRCHHPPGSKATFCTEALRLLLQSYCRAFPSSKHAQMVLIPWWCAIMHPARDVCQEALGVFLFLSTGPSIWSLRLKNELFRLLTGFVCSRGTRAKFKAVFHQVSDFRKWLRHVNFAPGTDCSEFCCAIKPCKFA